MKILDNKITQVGLDVHRTFSTASLRNSAGLVLSQQRLDHLDRTASREKISKWPARTPVVLEGTFGWMSRVGCAYTHTDPFLRG